MDRLITALEPFAFAVVLIAGATLAHWITISNTYIVGIATAFCAILLTLKHVYLQIKRG